MFGSAGSGPGIAWRQGFTFSEGVIEADLAAFTGHMGIAFWVQDAQHYCAVYFRPQNRPEDPVNGARGVQYVALPEYGWERLRREKGGAYENSASLPVPDSGAWFHVRLEVNSAVVNETGFGGIAVPPWTPRPKRFSVSLLSHEKEARHG